MKLRLLVLANSAKMGGRCVAGRQVMYRKGGYSLGKWYRPISDHSDGGLDATETSTPDGQQIKVLDFVEVDLRADAKDPLQPENWWFVAKSWRRLGGAYLPPAPAMLEESPPDLWLEPAPVGAGAGAGGGGGGAARSDRIAHAAVLRAPTQRSLYVVRVQDLRVKLSTEFSQWAKRAMPKSRAAFLYRGVEYDLPLTDPMVSFEYVQQFPKEGRPPKIVNLSDQAGRLLCVSLTAGHEGYHYKIAATVLKV